MYIHLLNFQSAGCFLLEPERRFYFAVIVKCQITVVVDCFYQSLSRETTEKTIEFGDLLRKEQAANSKLISTEKGKVPLWQYVTVGFTFYNSESEQPMKTIVAIVTKTRQFTEL